MATLVADTHKLITQLTSKGFSKQQAEAITEALRDLDTGGLASKADLDELRMDIHDQFQKLAWRFFAIIFAQSAFIIAVLQMLR